MSYYLVLSMSYLFVLVLRWSFLPMEPRAAAVISFPSSPSARWQLLCLLLCIVIVIGIGQLYVLGWLVPDFTWCNMRLGESINQVIIYSPILVYIIATRQTGDALWIPRQQWKQSLAIGLALSVIAIGVFWALTMHRHLLEILMDVYHVKNLHYAVQVFLEDLSIALLVSRIMAMIPARYVNAGILLVGLVFAFAHLPGNLHQSESTLLLLTERTLDALLVFLVLQVLKKTRDFLWLFPIHFAMDMMQFYSGVGFM